MKAATERQNNLKKVGNLRRMRKTISDLSSDLLGEILSRVPLTSLTAVRSTCKTWNALSKVQIFGTRAGAKKKHQFLEFMMKSSNLYSLRFDLRNNEDDFINLSLKKVSLPNLETEISRVVHCDGLLLCFTKEELEDNNTRARLVLWNPYLGQTKWIQPRTEFSSSDWFALGYDNNNHSHKILRVFYESGYKTYGRKNRFDVYDFASDSWKVLDVHPDSDYPDIHIMYHTGASLKGKTYFFGRKITPEQLVVTDVEDFLVCFDFTTERFGPRLALPFSHPSPLVEYITLSWVRDDKLSVLYNLFEVIEIWISDKIEHDAVSWSKFLRVDMSLINGLPDMFCDYFYPSNFFVDEEKKVAVLFGGDCYDLIKKASYIIGENGYFEYVSCESSKLVCSSFVPSLVQL